MTVKEMQMKFSSKRQFHEEKGNFKEQSTFTVVVNTTPPSSGKNISCKPGKKNGFKFDTGLRPAQFYD